MTNFERIKPNRKLNKLSALEYEEIKRKVKNKHCDRREMRKNKRVEFEEQ